MTESREWVARLTRHEVVLIELGLELLIEKYRQLADADVENPVGEWSQRVVDATNALTHVQDATYETVATVECAHCHGTGREGGRPYNELTAELPDCDYCGGAGREPYGAEVTLRG
jgi:hypothetical protein